MSTFIDLAGQTFGKWSVLPTSKSHKGRRAWLCRCECGTENFIAAGDLKKITKGGCTKCAIRTYRHGLSHTPIHQSWTGMVARCTNSNDKDWNLYGGRGVKVCNRWKSFDLFLVDMGQQWKPGLTIDRIDSNGNYELSNCRWATRLQQIRNRRLATYLDTPLGKMHLMEASKVYGVLPTTLRLRFRNGLRGEALLKKAKIYKRCASRLRLEHMKPAL
jgi:hypothetical protein